MSAVWWTPGNYGNRRIWFWHCFLDARAGWTCMESLGITELEYVYMSLEAESKRAVKIGLFQKKTEENAFIFGGTLFFLPLESHRF